MPGSTSRRDQHEDPRDNTVDVPRIDVDGLTDYFRRAAPMLEPEPAGLLEPLPEPEPTGLLEALPEQQAAPTPGSRSAPESRSYFMPVDARPGDLRHPYAEPDEPRPSAWRAVDGTPAPPVASEPTPPASNRGAADPDAAVPTAAAASSKASAPPPEVESTKPSRPAAEAGARDRAHVSGSGGRAPAGSLADLRSRLARLPDGHPSSPYEDDGHARPVPIRLKQLELGLPAPGREVVAGVAAESEEAENQLDGRPQDSTEPEPGEGADGSRAQAPPQAGNRDPVTAEHPATEVSAPNAPDAPAIAEPAADVDSGPAGLSGSSPAQPELADPYAAGNGHRARTSAESGPRADLTLGPWQDAPSRRVSGLEGLSPRGGNGHGPATGHRNASRRRESQVEPDRADRAPTAADRRDTAEYRMAELPAVDRRELVERTLATSRTAEGRNVLGSYGSSGLTPMMQRIAAHLPFGGLAPDSEANSLKSSDRLTAKLARLVTRNPGRTAEELAATIGDVVRYAFAFEASDYVEGTWLVHRRLKSHGFELELRRNRWESPEYKGIFTQWRDPAHHIAFEVQFHTTASWAVVQRTHDAYVQITNPATPPAERATLRARQVAAAATAKAPSNWAELGDFRLDAR